MSNKFKKKLESLAPKERYATPSNLKNLNGKMNGWIRIVSQFMQLMVMS
jgi:hypothetical protein